MTNKIATRPYTEGDEEAIQDLFELTFGQPLSETYWRWRFQSNPVGPAFIELAWDGDRLAAHYAASRVMLAIDGQETLSGLSGTTMTHPDYRGLGLFVTLAEKTYNAMAEAGSALVWGFPNANSHRGFVRDLQWVDVYEIPFFRKPLANSSPLSAPTGAIVELKRVDDRFDGLWDRVKQDYNVIVKRDRRYLQWRYMDNPSERYRLLAYLDGENVSGYAVFKHYKDEFQIVDMLTGQDAEIGMQLISQTAQIAAGESADTLSMWLSVTHPLHRELERYGFANSEPITYFGMRALTPGIPEAHIYNYRNWYVTMGDSDVF